ncbi:MAG: CpsB/CapC family capsule biosynthesis tyrosine phosphatase [bacterium]
MIDIHSHLLPNIDDGVGSFDEAIFLIKQAISVGITDIIVTPHYYPQRDFFADNKTKLAIFNELKSKASDLDIKLHLGNEVYMCADVKSLFETEILTLAESKYLLVEFSREHEDKNFLNYFHELQLKGYRIIIAHPERYKYFQKNINRMIPYLEKGIIFQGNYGSLYKIHGKKSKKALKLMLKHNMIQILATDSHRKDASYYKYISKFKHKDIQKLTVDNPSLILKNAEIYVEDYRRHTKKFLKKVSKGLNL